MSSLASSDISNQHKVTLRNKFEALQETTLLAGMVEYTDCTSAER